ncbi:MAG: hypothetical protein ACYS30_11475 [Planctomycetota bacterium]|jgi:hypothetical protein
MARKNITEKDIGYIDAESRKVVYPFLRKQFLFKPQEENRLLMVKILVQEYRL